jgi:tetratricopeptide (TPR) repeat protein
MTKYRIRLTNGRVIGPFIKTQLFELKSKGHIKGHEEAQIFPTGDWSPISSFEFYEELMDENRTIINRETQENTFVIDLTKLRQQVNESEIEKLDPASVPIEELTETVQMSPSVVKKEILSGPVPENPPPTLESKAGLELELDIDSEDSSHDRTQLNPIAQKDIERMRKELQEEERKKEAEAQRLAEEEAARQAAAALVVTEEEEPDDSTQVLKLDSIRNELMIVAEEEEEEIEKQLVAVKKKQKEEDEEDDDEEEDDESEEGKQKNKKRFKIILLIASLCIGYVVLFPGDDKPQKPPFQHLPPQIAFPIPYDKADSKKAEVELNRGKELFVTGGYPNIVKAGLLFKSSYENNLESTASLNLMVRSYGEQIRYSKKHTQDAQTLFNIIQSKRPTLVQDPNGVIGLSHFYMSINKPHAAADVVAKYLKLNSKNVTQDLFAVYLKSLMKIGKIDVANQFFQALTNAPDKNRYAYAALADYLFLNQESDKAEEYIDDAIKRNPNLATFYLTKAELLIKQQKFKEVTPYLQKAEELNLEYNDLNRAKFLELHGLLLAAQGNVKKATALLTESLKIEDSNELRTRLADLATTGGAEKDTDNLIAESKAIKYLIQAKDFYDKRSYELALSAAARASDAYPGHIPAELFLAKVQLKLGLAEQGLKTMEELIKKYPGNKDVNFALVGAYIDTYKFNNAKNRIAIISATDLKNDYQYASLNARLYMQMGDSLHAISWLKASLSANPLNDQDIYLMAEALTKRANFDAARTLLNKCMELDPINPDYRIAHARLIYEAQDDQAAIGYLLGLLDEFGESPKFLSEIAIFYYRAGKVKDFMDYRAKLEKLPNKDKALYEFLIKAALLDERYEEIPGLVEKLLQVEPGDLESMMTAGRVLFETGKLVEAAKWFRRIQDRLDSYPKVQYYIAKIKFLSGDLDGAMADVQKDMKDNGENDADLVFMAQVFEAKGELVDAENYYKRAQKLNPRSYEALVGLADISTKRNSYDLALDLYKRAMKQRGDNPIIHKKVGDVYRLLGQGALAIESYKLYLDMDPESPDKRQIQAYIQLME